MDASGLTGRALREQYDRIDETFRGRLEEIRETYAPVLERFENRADAPVEQAISQYVAAFDQARNPADPLAPLNFELLDALHSQLQADVGPDVWERVQATFQINRSEGRQELQRARQLLKEVGYFDIRDQLWQTAVANQPELQVYATPADLENAIRAQAFAVDPTGARGVAARLRRRVPALARIDRLTSRFRRRLRASRPDVAEAITRFYT